ncbi:MAG: hypothetical protein HFI10_13980 [Lachnospiraceae bacterium]|jgi:hypothetical protein|nr:hypothetical protein [Lachnospiraceae bacterium]
MTKEMKWMVNTILEEMERMENRINRRFEGIEDRLESMQHEINACKLERDSVSLLIGKVDQLERRIAS